MWVLFWMLDDETDHFTICADKAEAVTKYDSLVASTDNLSCAGTAPIHDSTEHWHTATT